MRTHTGGVTDDPDYLPHSFFAEKDCPCGATRGRMAKILADAKEMRTNERDDDPLDPAEKRAAELISAATKGVERPRVARIIKAAARWAATEGAKVK